MSKVVFLIIFFSFFSSAAMQGNQKQYEEAYKKTYQLGLVAINNYRNKGLLSARALALSQVMSKEMYKETTLELLQGKLIAYSDLLRSRADRFAASKN